MNAFVGVIKEIDRLGRIVIPKDIRERFGLDNYVEIIATEEGVVLRNPKHKLVRIDEDDAKNKINEAIENGAG